MTVRETDREHTHVATSNDIKNGAVLKL
ncbi:elongation factor P, partial [Micrococcus luteus]|nr:elongation factor P [Micrococcus luteus]